MDFLPTKTEFLTNAVKPCALPDDTPECPICQGAFQSEAVVSREPVRSEPVTQKSNATKNISNQTATSVIENHAPIKMSCCKNVFCRDCLNAWFDTANTCPTCRAELFIQNHRLDTDYIQMFVEDTPYGPMWVVVVLDDENEPESESESDSEPEVILEPEDPDYSDFSPSSEDSESDSDSDDEW